MIDDFQGDCLLMICVFWFMIGELCFWLLIGCVRWLVMIWMAWMMWIWGCEWLRAQVNEKQWVKSWKFLTWAESSTQVISSNLFCRIFTNMTNLSTLRSINQVDDRTPKNRVAARPSQLDILWFNLLFFEKHRPERNHPQASRNDFSDTIIWSHICFETSFCHCFLTSKIKYVWDYLTLDLVDWVQFQKCLNWFSI